MSPPPVDLGGLPASTLSNSLIEAHVHKHCSSPGLTGFVGWQDDYLNPRLQQLNSYLTFTRKTTALRAHLKYVGTVISIFKDTPKIQSKPFKG